MSCTGTCPHFNAVMSINHDVRATSAWTLRPSVDISKKNESIVPFKKKSFKKNVLKWRQNRIFHVSHAASGALWKVWIIVSLWNVMYYMGAHNVLCSLKSAFKISRECQYCLIARFAVLNEDYWWACCSLRAVLKTTPGIENDRSCSYFRSVAFTKKSRHANWK